MDEAPVQPDLKTYQFKKDNFKLFLSGKFIDDSVERRARATRGRRRQHSIGAQGQPSVCDIWPFHDMVILLMMIKVPMMKMMRMMRMMATRHQRQPPVQCVTFGSNKHTPSRSEISNLYHKLIEPLCDIRLRRHISVQRKRITFPRVQNLA